MDSLEDPSTPRRLLTISGMYIIPMLQLSAGLLNSITNGFPNNFFAILVYYFEVGDVSFGMITGNTVFTVLVNSTGDVTVVFFDYIL